MDKKTVLQSFNTLFFSFVDDVIYIFPEHKELVTAKHTFETFKSMNISLLLRTWYSHVFVPYSKEIFEGNLSYFINKNYEQDIAGLSHTQSIMSTIDSFRNKIRDMSKDNQEKSLDYLQKLSKLSKLWYDMT
jgi:hypothetical protein